MDMLAHELGTNSSYFAQNQCITGRQPNEYWSAPGRKRWLDGLPLIKLKFISTRLLGPEPFKPQKIRRDGKDYITCWGVSAAYKNTGLASDLDKGAADVELRLDGSLQVRTAAAEIGQGLVTWRCFW